MQTFKSHILDKPVWTLFKHFDVKKDGQEVVLALKKQREGEDANIIKAYTKLSLSQFTGR